MFKTKPNTINKVWSLAGVLIVFGFLLFVRLYRLGSIPSVLNGDETANILHPIQMLCGKLNLLDLTHDGSVPAFIFLPKMMFILSLGLEQHSLLAVRSVTVIYSILSLFIFYLIVKKEINRTIAFLVTFLFGTSYWFMNFSRLSWIAMDNVFWSLLLYWLVSRFVKGKSSNLFAVLAGLTATMVAINYMGGRIALLAIIIYLLSQQKQVIGNRQRKTAILLGVFVFIVSISPFVWSFLSNKQSYLGRPSNLYVFDLKDPYYQIEPHNKFEILKHQIFYSIKGFILFDPRVSGEGVENHRLMPFGHPAINYLLIPAYYLGLIASVARRRGYYFVSLLLLNIIMLQIPSVLIPSWSRSLIILPALYYFVASGLFTLFSTLRLIKHNRLRHCSVFIFIFFVLFVGISDIKTYWKWVNSNEFINSQQPAISVNEVPAYQNVQIQKIMQGFYPLNFSEWNDLKVQYPYILN